MGFLCGGESARDLTYQVSEICPAVVQRFLQYGGSGDGLATRSEFVRIGYYLHSGHEE